MGYRLTTITSKNFMKLPDGEYSLLGDVGFIKGRNSQGKSSLLHVIQYVLGTRIGVGITNPINVTEDKAKVVAEFKHDSGEVYHLVIEFARKGEKTSTKSYIVTKDGAKISKKADMLNFLGNPPATVNIAEVAKNQGTAAGQLRNLKNLFQPVMGIDVEEQVSLLKETKDANAELKKQIKQIEGMFATHSLSPDEATEEMQPIDPQEVAQEYERIRRAKVEYDDALSYVQGYEQRKARIKDATSDAESALGEDILERKNSVKNKIQSLKAQIAELEAITFEPAPSLKREYDDCLQIEKDAEAKYSECEKVIAAGVPDLDAADKALAEVHEKNARINLVNSMVAHSKDLTEKRSNLAIGAQTEADIIGAINDAITVARENVNLPDRFQIRVGEDGAVGIFYKDPDTDMVVPFNENQVARSQMMLGSLALTLASFEASDSELKMVTLPDASLMDKRTMLAAIELAEQYGFSIYPEIVTEEDGVKVEIFNKYEDAKAAL